MKAVKRRHLYLSPPILLPTPSGRGEGGRGVYPLSIPYGGKAKACPPLTTNIVPTHHHMKGLYNTSSSLSSIRDHSRWWHPLIRGGGPPYQRGVSLTKTLSKKNKSFKKAMINFVSHNLSMLESLSQIVKEKTNAIPQESCKLLKHNKIDKEVVVYG